MNDHLYIWTPCVRPQLLGALAHSVAQAAAGGVLDDVSLIADIVGPSSYEHRCDRVLERIKALAVSPTAWFWFTSDDTLVTAACIRAWRQTVALHPEISCIMLRQQRVERSAEPDFLPRATTSCASAKYFASSRTIRRPSRLCHTSHHIIRDGSAVGIRIPNL